MKTFETHDDLISDLHRLNSRLTGLLNDPQPGTRSWWMFLANVLDELQEIRDSRKA